VDSACFGFEKKYGFFEGGQKSLTDLEIKNPSRVMEAEVA
jgi:hypothetical protein